MKAVRPKLTVGRPSLPLGSAPVVVHLSPRDRERAKKLGDGKITQGIRNALEASMTELDRKNKVAALLARAIKLNAEFASLVAERHMISEQIYELQSAYEKETTS